MILPKPIKPAKAHPPRIRRSKPKKRKKPTRKQLVKKLDKLWADRIKASGKCHFAGDGHECKNGLQAMHGISRRYYGTRWNLDNGVPGCGAIHFRFTRDPQFWDYALITLWGYRRWEEMWKLAREVKDHDLAAVEAYLTEVRH